MKRFLSREILLFTFKTIGDLFLLHLQMSASIEFLFDYFLRKQFPYDGFVVFVFREPPIAGKYVCSGLLTFG